jgi:hypothetical protein
MSLLVSLAFKRYSDDKLVSFTNTVFQRMSADAQYVSKPKEHDCTSST